MQFLKKASSLFAVSVDITDNTHRLMETKFQAHLSEYGISYGTQEEYAFRLERFAEMDQHIEKTNSEQSSYWLAHNQFSTMTRDEYKKMLGKKPSDKIEESRVVELDEESPKAVDWRKKGAVNPVQNQGQCGSCWAFSSTAAMEGAHFIKTGKLLKLSEEQFVDCVKDCDGCDGGLEMYAFKYAEKHGQESEASYPYKAGNGKSGHCKYEKSKGEVDATTYAHVKKRSSSQLKAAVAKQPTCVSVDAAGKDWQSYKGGIYDNKKCGTDLDHAVTAVGYGTEKGQDYWIVRNSWTSSWGEEGYIRIADNGDGSGICGILLDSTRPTTD